MGHPAHFAGGQVPPERQAQPHTSGVTYTGLFRVYVRQPYVNIVPPFRGRTTRRRYQRRKKAPSCDVMKAERHRRVCDQVESCLPWLLWRQQPEATVTRKGAEGWPPLSRIPTYQQVR
jgi:hypothetical protein